MEANDEHNVHTSAQGKTYYRTPGGELRKMPRLRPMDGERFRPRQIQFALLALQETGARVVDATTEDDQSWRERALCREADPEIFFKTDKTLMDSADRQQAMRICKACPVRPQCLKDGLDQPAGIWGGMTPEERLDLMIKIQHMPGPAQNVVITSAALKAPNPIHI